ncbi:hypothetical protein WDW37_17080 [Bdellovibrionota bacterium FG-1]
MKKVIMALLAVTAMSGSFAFANRGDSINIAAIRQETKNQVQAKIRVEGVLKCDVQATQNQGQGCQLKVEETKTGTIFNLIEASTAMRLYLNGSHQVAIEGAPVNSNTIRVQKAETF